MFSYIIVLFIIIMSIITIGMSIGMRRALFLIRRRQANRGVGKSGNAFSIEIQDYSPCVPN